MDISKVLKKHGQEHLLKYYDELDIEKQNHLIKQIMDIDFEEIEELYQLTTKKEKTKSSNIKPLQGVETIDPKWPAVGIELIKRGKYAVVTMAGGQGTRLGFDGPKGTYILEYGINKSLFEIQCDKLKEIYSNYKTYVNWYIMTSHDNHEATIEFFETNNYFNYPKDKIKFFMQGLLPMLHTNGKVIMDDKHNIKLGPNGSGGVFKAMLDNGITKKLENDGVEYVFIGGIDNVLLPISDPTLIGYAKKEKFLAASLSVVKDYPEEKVGIFALKDNKPCILEYIHISEEMAHQRDEKGELVYSDLNLQAYVFNIEIIKELQDKPLPYSAALKKSDYLDSRGKLKEAKKENAYKFELFLFDIFPYMDKIGLIREKRCNAFAPVKNKDGVDSPETASKLYKDYHQKSKIKPCWKVCLALLVGIGIAIWGLALYFKMLEVGSSCETPTLAMFPIGIKLLFLLLVLPVGVIAEMVAHLLSKKKNDIREYYRAKIIWLILILVIITPIIIFIFGRFALIWCFIAILPILLLIIYNSYRFIKYKK